MKLRRIVVFFVILLLSRTAYAQATPAWAKETPAQKEKRMQWWTEARFGLFLHWGLYSVPARHEWIKTLENIPDKDYQKYFDCFNPDLYHPEEWAKQAKEAGMKYFVITTKHHEGFCLWDSKFTDYKAPNTPAQADLLKPLVEAFRKEGIKVGFYYSLIDWHHPDFTMDNIYPCHNSTDMEAYNKNRNMDRYRKYMKDQLKELLTNYGQIDLLFLDFSYPGKNGKDHNDWDSEGLFKLVRELQPNIIINNRADLDSTSWGWDFKTPEQFMPDKWVEVDGKRVPWETCQTFSGSWGYARDEYSWKSTHQLIAMLIETVSKGGNLLLNVGPTARGSFDSRANERLQGIGKWMSVHKRSIYSCTQAPDEFKTPQNCLMTYNPQAKRLYIHVLEWPFKSLHLKGYKGKIKYAQLLNDGSEIRYFSPNGGGDHMDETGGDNDIILRLPVQRPDVEVPVIELFLE